MSRLETLSPELSARLQRASVTQQRAAGLAASAFAISHANVENPAINEALLTLRLGGNLSSDKKTQIQHLAERYDKEYLDLYADSEQGRVPAEDYLRVFEKARAIASILFAFKDDSFEGAAEAIYEAAAVTDNPKDLFSAVEALLR